jgi:hypothetical protein
MVRGRAVSCLFSSGLGAAASMDPQGVGQDWGNSIVATPVLIVASISAHFNSRRAAQSLRECCARSATDGILGA